MATLTGLDLCHQAAVEVGHLDPQETLSAADGAWILGKLNGVLDDWNAEREAVYADVITVYDTVGGLSPHTIGPTGTWVTPARPVTIDGAHVLTTAPPSPPVRGAPLGLQSKSWWFARSLPAQTAEWPTDLYYDPSSPNGSLYFWPVPSGVVTIELLTRLVLASLTLAATISLPPGYENALVLTTAEAIAAPLGIALSPGTALQATQARARIGVLNRRPTPGLQTHDAGMPGGRSGTTYDYRTGSWR